MLIGQISIIGHNAVSVPLLSFVIISTLNKTVGHSRIGGGDNY